MADKFFEIVRSKMKLRNSNHSKRKLWNLQEAKSKKDRYTLLSDVAQDSLRECFPAHKPKDDLFGGAEGRKHFFERSFQQVFELTVKKAGIRKQVSVHSLRHTFATLSFESGMRLRYIHELLGQRSSKTTEIYTHASSTSLGKIISPVDDAMSRKEE